MELSTIVDFNPYTPISKEVASPFVDMASLPIHNKIFHIAANKIYTNSGAKFIDGDTLLARITPCLENGKGGFVSGLGEGIVGHGSTEFIIMRPKSNNDLHFVYYISRLPEFREFAIKHMSGTSGRQRVNWQSLAKFEIENINQDNRKKIGEILGALDDKIDLNRRTNQTLEAMARALFKDWFVDFGPTRAKQAGQPPYLAPQVWALFPSSLDPTTGLPEGWVSDSIYKISDVIYGAPFASKLFNSEKIGKPLVRIRDLANESPSIYTPEIHPKGYLIQPGDIVVGMDGEFRAHLWGGAEAWLNQRVCIFKPKNKFSAAFVRNSIMLPLAHIEETEIATTVIHLGKNDIDLFKVTIANHEINKTFDQLAQPLYDEIVKLKLEARTLAQLRDALLPKLMSGQLRLKHAQHLVEAAV